MNTFVKVKGYEHWYLLVRSVEECPPYEAFQSKMEQSQVALMSEDIKKGTFLPLDYYVSRLDIVKTNKVDYVKAISKHKEPILIQENGAYCSLSDSEIVETIQKNTLYWPKFGEIVICENDSTPEDYWTEYLGLNYPGKKICTLNLFCARSVEEIAEQISDKNIITFCTTFSKIDWFENLVQAVVTNNMKGKKFVLFCLDREKWDDTDIKTAIQMLEINNTVHIVKSLS